MKVIRQPIRLHGNKVVHVAYVKANWLERRVLRRMMREGRHNLRPAHNWAGPRSLGASFILRAKGRPNPDPGPDVRPPRWLAFITRKHFNWLDMVAISVAAVTWREHPIVTAVGMVGVAGLSVFLTVREARRGYVKVQG